MTVQRWFCFQIVIGKKSVACIVNTRCTVNLLAKALHVLAVDSNDTRKE